jgi:hypothetical protein
MAFPASGWRSIINKPTSYDDFFPQELPLSVCGDRARRRLPEHQTVDKGGDIESRRHVDKRCGNQRPADDLPKEWQPDLKTPRRCHEHNGREEACEAARQGIAGQGRTVDQIPEPIGVEQIEWMAGEQGPQGGERDEPPEHGRGLKCRADGCPHQTDRRGEAQPIIDPAHRPVIEPNEALRFDTASNCE